MPTVIIEVDTYDASIVVPEDGDEADAGSVLAAFQPLANRTHNLNGRVTALADNRLGTKMLSNVGLMSLDASGNNNLDGVGYGKIRFIVGSALAYYDLSGILVDGCTITEVGARIKPATANAGISARMMVTLLKKPIMSLGAADWTPLTPIPPSSGGSNVDDGSTSAQTLSLPLTEVVDMTVNTYAIALRGSATAATGAPDDVGGLYITLA